jgi:L-threonylcarbamoyladenylate synthase
MDKFDISRAIAALKNGQVIVYPTDTLYGLGADIFNNAAVKKVFEIKKRPKNKPLPVAVSSINEIKNIAVVNDEIIIIANSFLPGKLTLILKKRSVVPDIVTSGLENIAVRIPKNKIALDLLKNFGPLTVTSANIHDKKTPFTINDIKMQFKDSNISIYLDDGKLDSQPSTIIDMTKKPIKILRAGAISEKDIMDVIKND